MTSEKRRGIGSSPFVAKHKFDAEHTQAKPWVTTQWNSNTLGLNHSVYQMTNATQDLPDWGKMPNKPGLYLSLSHGRAFPQEALKKRGFAGPKIGPLLYMRTEYAQQVTLRFASKRDAARFFPNAATAINVMQIIEGTLVYDQKCYGDWDVCYITAEFCRSN